MPPQRILGGRATHHGGDGGAQCLGGGGSGDVAAVVASPVVEGAVGNAGDVLGQVQRGGDDDHAKEQEEERVCWEEWQRRHVSTCFVLL